MTRLKPTRPNRVIPSGTWYYPWRALLDGRMLRSATAVRSHHPNAAARVAECRDAEHRSAARVRSTYKLICAWLVVFRTLAALSFLKARACRQADRTHTPETRPVRSEQRRARCPSMQRMPEHGLKPSFASSTRTIRSPTRRERIERLKPTLLR